MLLGIQADGIFVLDQLMSMWLPGTIDIVSADGECAACLPRGLPGWACSPSGSHFSSTAAIHVSREKNFCKAWCHRYSCNRSCTVSLLLWYFGCFILLPLFSCCSFSLSLFLHHSLAHRCVPVPGDSQPLPLNLQAETYFRVLISHMKLVNNSQRTRPFLGLFLFCWLLFWWLSCFITFLFTKTDWNWKQALRKGNVS